MLWLHVSRIQSLVLMLTVVVYHHMTVTGQSTDSDVITLEQAPMPPANITSVAPIAEPETAFAETETAFGETETAFLEPETAVGEPGAAVDERETAVVDDDLNNAGNDTDDQNAVLAHHKVLIFGYPRGGMDLITSMFHHVPNSIYWNEPLDGLYSHMFALRPRVHPVDVTQKWNGHYREYSVQERETVRDLILNCMSCNISAMPIEVIAMTGQLRTQMRKWWRPLMDCLPTERVPEAKSCMSHTKDHCGRIMQDNIERNCWDLLVSSREAIHKTSSELEELYPDQDDREQMEDFILQEECLSEMRQLFMPCVNTVEEVCHMASYRVTKIMRMRMEHMVDILRKDDKITIIYVMRDPRAILYSRDVTNSTSRVGHNIIKEEAVTLCRQLMEDLETLRELENEYPNNIIKVKYELMLEDSDRVIDYIFRNLGKVPDNLKGAVRTLIATHIEGETGSWYINVDEYVNAWRAELNVELKKHIDYHCRDVFEPLRYEV